MSVKLDLVVGARPNVMKMAPLLAALLAADRTLDVRVVHTGQHFDALMAHPMGDDIAERYGRHCRTAQLSSVSGTQGVQTAGILVEYEKLLLQSDLPRGIVVFGDVNSTLAATLAGVKLGISVAHVEAGLRSFDRSMPEEVNRVIVDALAEVMLTTESAANENLLREGRSPEQIHLVGNVMIDTLVEHLDEARALGVAGSLGLPAGEFAYVTLHRPPNVDDPERLQRYLAMLSDLSRRMPVVFCVHPRTRERIEAAGLSSALDGGDAMLVLEPQPYVRNLALVEAARVVLTDSGGMQDETAYLGIPCLTLRTSTERPVTLESGINRLMPAAPDGVLDAVEEILGGSDRIRATSAIPFWDGRAAERAATVILDSWA